MEEEEFTEILDSFEEKVLRLERKLPIYIEYNVTTVDEEGQPYFLTDVYRYDAAVYDGELPVVNEYELEAWNEGEKVPFKGVVAVKKL